MSRDNHRIPRWRVGILQRGGQRGLDGLAPDRPGPVANQQPGHPAQAPALLLRQEHPTWGAGLIRVMLQRQGIQAPPDVRTLQRWFAKAGLGPAAPGRQSNAVKKCRATRPHETWQVDAAEDIALADGTRASWLRIADEFTGAVLRTVIFPLGRWNAVPAYETQKQLRQAFCHWGMPAQVRVDNGTP